MFVVSHAAQRSGVPTALHSVPCLTTNEFWDRLLDACSLHPFNPLPESVDSNLSDPSDPTPCFTMNYLSLPLPLFRQSLRDLLRQPTRTLRFPVGISRWEGNVELLAAPSNTQRRNELRDYEQRRTLLLSLTDDFTLPSSLPADCAGVLLIGRERQRGQARGFVQLTPNQLEPLDTLHLVGAGMFTVRLNDQFPMTNDQSAQPLDTGHWALDIPERWSRTVGALGLDVWHRLITLRYALIGVGRSGSSLALALARLGARHLTLIDPDTIEPHNLGEMEGVTEADIGKPKVEALAAHLSAQFPNFPISQFPNFPISQFPNFPSPTPSPACAPSTPPKPVTFSSAARTTTAPASPPPRLPPFSASRS